jgi:hypothetical protein
LTNNTGKSVTLPGKEKNKCPFKYVMHLNIQGTFSKVLELVVLLNDLEEEQTNIYYISLNEHWLKENQIQVLNNLGDFKLGDYCCRKNNDRGGSCILYRNTEENNIKIRHDIKTLSEDFIFEVSAIENVRTNTILLSIYRVPYYKTTEHYLKKLASLLKLLQKESKKKYIYICTDNNFNVLNCDVQFYLPHSNNCLENTEKSFYGYNKYTQEYINLLLSYGYTLNFNEATRVTCTSQTCIDNIITNSIVHRGKKHTSETGMSDHKALLLILVSNIMVIKTPTKNDKITKRVFNEKRIDQFKEKIQLQDWDYDKFLSTDENYSKFLNTFLSIFQITFPIMSFNAKETRKIKWITKGLIISSKRRRHLHREMKQSKDDKIISYYKSYNKIYKKNY